MKNSSFTFGMHGVEEAIKANQLISKVFIQNNLPSAKYKLLSQLLKQHDIPFQRVPFSKLNRITRKKHQGVIAVFSKVPYANLGHIIQNTFEKGKMPFIILLDNLTNVGNIGSIARTAVCGGVDALVVEHKKGFTIDENLIQASSGAITHLPICQVKNFTETIQELQASGIYVIGSNEKAKKSIYEVKADIPLALIVGSENKGIHPANLAVVNEKVSIPMHGKVAALNVAIATGVIIYEVLRQRESK